MAENTIRENMMHIHSIDDIIGVCEQPRAGQWAHKHESGPSKDFTHNTDLQQAKTLLQQGWPEGLQDLTFALDDMSLPGTQHHTHVTLAEAGFACHSPAFASGDPRCMLNVTKKARQTRVWRIGVPVAYACMHDSPAIIDHGAAICAMIDAIEEQNVRVELTAFILLQGGQVAKHGPLTDGDEGIGIAITIKHAHQPVDMDRMAFVLCHPAFFRQLGFRMCETMSEWFPIIQNHYGWVGYNRVAIPGYRWLPILSVHKQYRDQVARASDYLKIVTNQTTNE